MVFAVNAESLAVGVRERTSLRDPQLEPEEGVSKQEVCLETIVFADTKEGWKPNRKHSFATIGNTNVVPSRIVQIGGDVVARRGAKMVSGGESRCRFKNPRDGAGQFVEHGGNVAGVGIGADLGGGQEAVMVKKFTINRSVHVAHK